MIRAANLVRPIEELELPSGRIVPIWGISGAAYEMQKALIAAYQNPEGSTVTDDDVWRYGEALLPDATPAEVRQLSAQQIASIGQIASGHLDAVLKLAEEAAGNSKGRPAASSSAPKTGSRTRGSKSGKRSARGRARS